MCGSILIGFPTSRSADVSLTAPPRMRMRLEVQLPRPPIGYVGVQLRRGEISVPQHLLDGAEIGAALEEMRRKRVAKEVRMDAFGLQTRLRGKAAQDQEGAGPCQGSAARVQEQLGAMACVEKRAPAREIAADRFDGRTTDRHDAFLASLAERAHDPRLEVDVALPETDGFTDAQPGAVEELDERTVTVGSWRCSRGGLDQPLRLGRRECAWEPGMTPRKGELCGRVVGTRPEQHLVTEERPKGCHTTRNRRAREPCSAELGEVGLELFDAGARDRRAEPVAECSQ